MFGHLIFDGFSMRMNLIGQKNDINKSPNYHPFVQSYAISLCSVTLTYLKHAIIYVKSHTKTNTERTIQLSSH